MNKFCSNCGGKLEHLNNNYCPQCGKHLNNNDDQTKYAGFWIRFLAYLIDAVCLGVIGFVVGFIGGLYFYEFISTITKEELDSISQLIGLIIGWIYFATLESSKWQATIGKKALSLKVTDYNEEKITFKRASGRFFSKLLSALTLLVGYIMAAFTKKKQALHDKVASTYVLKN